LVRLARRGLANAVRPDAERKMTVFFFRVVLKLRPRIVSTLPTLMRIGVTRVIAGFFLALAADAAGALTSRAVADSASRQMM
jgi:hypothetical protein